MRFVTTLRTWIEGWTFPRWDQLAFDRLDAAILVALAGLTLAVVSLLARSFRRHGRQRDGVALPAFLGVFHRSRPLQTIRYLPAVCFMAGVPFFVLALADPVTRLIREDVSYPGRRIALFIDASASMGDFFKATTLKPVGERSYFTGVAAAEYFVRLRMDGRYRDLIALIQFGDEAYVLTPFTTDYENLLLTLALIDDWVEWGRFDAPGTVILNAFDVAIGLFRSFDFLEASGNAMILMSDGDDSQVRNGGRPLDAVVAQAVKYRIPIYMLRVAPNKAFGDVLPDRTWKAAVERTGGRFYPVSDEAAMLAAVREIDRLVVGEIDVTRYSANRPRFEPFAVAALLVWGLGLALRVAVPYFGTFS
jgi:hypothetical protein